MSVLAYFFFIAKILLVSDFKMAMYFFTALESRAQTYCVTNAAYL